MKRLLVLILLASTCFSTSVISRSIEEMTQDSTDVIIGQAGIPQSQWNAAHTMIYTITPVRIETALKGSRSGVVMVTQMGGTLDGIHTKIEGIRQFQPHERAALFLRPSVDMPGTFVLSSMVQGHFTVDAQGNASNGVSGVHTLDTRTKQLSETSGSILSLERLKARVKAVAK